jgi:hypothetical protein
VRLYRLTIKAPPYNLPPRYNICPTDPVDAVTERDGSRGFVRRRWGLVPSLWPKLLKGLKAAGFNARAETVAEKPFSGCLPTNPPPHPCIGIPRREQSSKPNSCGAFEAGERRCGLATDGREWRSITAMSAFKILRMEFSRESD